VIILTIIFMDLLTGMEFDLFVPSFPQLQSYFHITPFWVEALLSVNFIGYCLSLFFIGHLSDRYGRKPIILAGLATFIVGSVLCLCEQSYVFLLIGRFLQGIGIAAPAILSFLIIADRYPIKKQQFLMAMLNGSMNTAVAAAPVIGSYIALYFHWQGNFITLLLLGILTTIMTLFFIPAYKSTRQDETISHGYIKLFRSKPLMLLMTASFISFVPYWIFVGMSPLLYMKELNVSLQHFGYYQGALALVFALGSVAFGLIIKNKHYDERKMLIITAQIYIVSLTMVTLLVFFNSTNPLLITLSILVFVIGQIIPSTILGPLCLNYIPQAKGRVSALVQGGRLIMVALSLQIAGHFYRGSFQNIGIITAIFIFLTILTMFFVIRNREVMKAD
jgi:DHA1 family bicyclomycin/chloramphenicol resistance-like MFS transporter